MMGLAFIILYATFVVYDGTGVIAEHYDKNCPDCEIVTGMEG